LIKRVEISRSFEFFFVVVVVFPVQLVHCWRIPVLFVGR
jgi:hypothetical protein